MLWFLPFETYQSIPVVPFPSLMLMSCNHSDRWITIFSFRELIFRFYCLARGGEKMAGWTITPSQIISKHRTCKTAAVTIEHIQLDCHSFIWNTAVSKMSKKHGVKTKWESKLIKSYCDACKNYLTHGSWHFRAVAMTSATCDFQCDTATYIR